MSIKLRLITDIFIKSFIIAISLANLNLYAQNCEDSWLIHAKLQLDTNLITYKPITGLQFADSIFNKIKENKLEHCETTHWINYNRSELLELNNQHKEALDIYYSISALAKESSLRELYISCQISIARVMETIARGEDCKRHLKEAKKYIDQYQILKLYPFYCVRISSYYRIFEDKDSARYYANKAIYYAVQFQNSRQLSDGYFLLGILTSNIDTSYNVMQKAYKQFLINKNFQACASMALNISIKIRESKYSSEASKWKDSAFKNIELIKDHNYFFHHTCNKYYKDKSEIFFSKNIHDSAYYYLNLSREHLSKSNVDVNQASVSQAEIDYITSSERFKTETLSKQARFQKILSAILVLGLLSSIAFAYYLNKRNKKIEKQKLQIQNQKDELINSLNKQSLLLSEVHHRVKNNLQLVISLLTLHFNKVKDNEEYQYLEDISNKVRSIALIHEHLYNTGEFERIDLKSYLHDLLEHYLALHIVETQFTYTLESQDNIHLNLETVMPIGIICTELISNSLKYARQKDKVLHLDIKLQILESKYILKYQDNGPIKTNGVGEKNKSGMGTILIESMVRQLQAQSSPIVNGTSTFNLIFQEKKVSAV